MADLNSTIVRGKLRVTEDINANGNITGNGSRCPPVPPRNPRSGTSRAKLHNPPTADSGSELTAKISETASAYEKDKEYTVLTGVKAQRDAKGHITGLTYTAQKVKDTNTTYMAALNGGLYLSNANVFSLKTATASEIGGVKSSTTGTAANRDYKVQVNDDGTMKVNVPWTDNNTTYSAGTGLSLNSSNNTFSVKTGYTTDANNRNYKVAADSNGNLYVNVPWSSSGTLDTSLSSTSTNALQNKAIYAAFASAVGFVADYYYFGGSYGSWRIKENNNNAHSLDIRYGTITINSQSSNYSASFKKSMNNTNYTVVFGLYRGSTQSWFWSPIVQSKGTSGFTVFLRGNASGDNAGTINYIAIRINSGSN